MKVFTTAKVKITRELLTKCTEGDDKSQLVLAGAITELSDRIAASVVGCIDRAAVMENAGKPDDILTLRINLGIYE